MSTVRVCLLLAALVLTLAAPASATRVRARDAAAPLTADQSIQRLPLKSIDTDASVVAAQQMIARYYPHRVGEFNLSITPKAQSTDPDWFTLSTTGTGTGRVVVNVAGTSANMLTAGFNHYLRRYLSVNLLTWSASHSVPPLPATLVAVASPVTVDYQYLLRYWYNICTLSYTTVWWDWSQWEREIDWMALRGVNFPLALTGQELVWVQLYREMGLNDTEIKQFLSGPAFYTWQRMGNIQGWAGPVTDNWLQKQVTLQQQILSRMRELDMMPVLAGFNGYVPMALKYHYPKARINATGEWATFPLQYRSDDLLDPTDPLFQTIGTRYIQLQTELFGTDHFYNSDTFNENAPISSDPTYIAAVSAAVYQSMVKADRSAVWVMQGWVFVNDPSYWQPKMVQSYLDPVPNDRMIILDLMSDIRPIFPTVNNYYGKLFIWCMLQNFGGNNGMGAFIDIIASQPPLALQSVGKQLIGIGSTPEGTLQNEIIFDLLFDMAMAASPVAVDDWVNDYVTARYSLPSNNVEDADFNSVYDAYQILAVTVYNNTNINDWGVVKSYIELTPDLTMTNDGFMPTVYHYDNNDLGEAVMLMLGSAEMMAALSVTAYQRYQYDVVDFTKQWLSNTLMAYHQQLVAAYTAKNLNQTQAMAAKIITLIDDFDRLLASNDRFLLGRWIEDARRWGDSIEEQDWLEFNARNQITLWGPSGQINDYASKQWSGLISSYYKPRWQTFVSQLVAAVRSGTPWDASQYDASVMAAEQVWQNAKDKFPVTPLGDTVEIARYIYRTYSSL